MEMMERGHAGSERMYTRNTGHVCVCVCVELAMQQRISDEGRAVLNREDLHCVGLNRKKC